MALLGPTGAPVHAAPLGGGGALEPRRERAARVVDSRRGRVARMVGEVNRLWRKPKVGSKSKDVFSPHSTSVGGGGV